MIKWRRRKFGKAGSSRLSGFQRKLSGFIKCMDQESVVAWMERAVILSGHVIKSPQVTHSSFFFLRFFPVDFVFPQVTIPPPKNSNFKALFWLDDYDKLISDIIWLAELPEDIAFERQMPWKTERQRTRYATIRFKFTCLSAHSHAWYNIWCVALSITIDF